jgi:hypothetical protein
MVDTDEQLPYFIHTPHGTDNGMNVVYQIQAVGQVQRRHSNGDKQGRQQGKLGQPPYVPGEETGMYHLKQGHCWNCFQTGHYSNQCPYKKQEEKYNLCVNCRQSGHLIKDCPHKIVIRPLVPKVTPIPYEKLYLNYGVSIPADDAPAQNKPSKA